MTKHTTTAKDGVKLTYGVYGEGPNLIMLVMGLGMPGDVWMPLVEMLLEHDVTVVVPDNRGTGQSANVTKPWRMTDMGDDAATILREVDRGPAIVCGVSMGGMVSQQLAIRHPELVSGLVLCNTTCGLPTGKFLNPEALLLLLRLALFPKTASHELAHRLLAHPDSTGIIEKFNAKVAKGMGAHPTTPRGMFFQLLAAASHNAGKHLHRIKVPTLVVVADSDFLIPNENSHILAKHIPNAELRIIEKTGHILPHERPDVLQHALMDTLEMIHDHGR